MVFRSIRKGGLWGFPLFLLATSAIVTSGGLTMAVPKGDYARPELLIEPQELKDLLDRKEPSIRVIDIRDRLKYHAGHIPGALHVWRPDIVDKDHPMPGMMASQAQIEALMGRLGIQETDTLVIYSDGPDNARLWWVLAYYGFPIAQMKLLDGGIDGWKEKGYPTELLSPKVSQTRFRLPGRSKGREHLLCDLPQVKEALHDTRKVVLDVRSKREYLGEETLQGAVRPGRIPGVVWIEWKETLIPDGPYKGYWKPAEEIRKIFSSRGITPDKDVYMY